MKKDNWVDLELWQLQQVYVTNKTYKQINIQKHATWSHDENVPVGTFLQDAKYETISIHHSSFQHKLTI